MSTATATPRRFKLQNLAIDEQNSIARFCNLTLLGVAVAVDMTEGLTALSHCYFGPERSLFAAPEGKEKDKHKKEAR